MVDLLVVTSAPPTPRMTKPGGVIWRFERLLGVLAGEVGLDWPRTQVSRMSALPKRPRNVKKYMHQGKGRPHDEILEQRNGLFEAINELNPRLIMTLGTPAANIVIKGRTNKPPGINLAEDRYGLFYAPLRHVTWEDKERKRAGKKVLVREYIDTVVPDSPLFPVTCTWSPGEVGMQPRLRNNFCEDIERALEWLKENR
jgi:hypothetical protein